MKSKASIHSSKKKAAALLSSNRLLEAKNLLVQVCKADPADIDSWIHLVQIYAQLNQPAEVERCCRAVISVIPDSPDAHYHLGCALMMQGKYPDAGVSFRQVIQQYPGHALALLHLGKVLHLLNKLDEALSCYQEAVRHMPTLAEAYSGIGNILENTGQIDGAMEQYRKALQINPDLVEANVGLGLVLAHLGEFEEAEKHVARVLQIDHHNADAVALAANIANRTGDKDRALTLLLPLIDSGSNHVNIAIAFAGACEDERHIEYAITMMERILTNSQRLSNADRFSLHFGLGRLYDRTGKYDNAFMHYREGNELKPASFDLQQYRMETCELMAAYDATFMAGAPRSRVHSKLPVFIIGMVRSGTSLVEQILASHPDIHGAGELPDITLMTQSLQRTLGSDQRYPKCIPQLTQGIVDRLARTYLDRLEYIAPEATCITDKMPANFAHLGLIEILFPDARIIHCKRDPMDTCLSAYFQDFSQSHPYSYDLENLGAVYNQYLAIMEHWRKVLKIPMLEVQYEDLIANQEDISRELVAFCGMSWNERCLQFHQATRLVATASFDQVRRPLYKKSVGRWKDYEHYLQPLRKALEQG